MNVDDIDQEFDAECKLEAIFNRQSELMVKYHPIEESNGFKAKPPPLDLHDRFDQHRLKDFAWRVTEELTEATEAIQVHQELVQHCQEEIADAYHFLVELSILSGVGPDNIAKKKCRLDFIFIDFKKVSNIRYIRRSAYGVVEEIGLAMNCLKNKPWKKTHMLTDEHKYKDHIVAAHHAFPILCMDAGMDSNDLFQMYFKKSEVNKFRQRSNY